MTSDDVNVGEILHFYSTHTKPHKDKFHICVAANSFFVVNTLPNFPPVVPIAQKEYKFLGYDSFICCSLLCEFEPDRFIPDTARRGNISRATAQAIVAALPAAKTLTQGQKTLLAAALSAIN